MPYREGDPIPGTDAMQLLEEWFPTTPANAERRERYYVDMLVAGMIYDARIAAGLTQAELAERIGTSASAISRLEDYEYEGHSLAMLRRVAKALGKRVELRLVDVEAETDQPPTNEAATRTRKARVKRDAQRERERHLRLR